MLHLPAGRDPSQPIILLNPAQDPFAPLVVPAFTHDRPIRHPNPGGDQVDVVMRGVRMPHHHVLGALKPHLLKVTTGNRVPLVVTEPLPSRKRQACVVNGAAHVGFKLPAFGKLSGQLLGILPQHVAADLF